MKAKKLLGASIVLLMMAGMFAGCSDNAGTTQKNTGNQTSALSGTINLGGSTSVEEVAIASLDEFTAVNPKVSGKYDSTGSSTGIKNAIDGTYHLGFSSRDLTQEEINAGLTYKAIALDGIALAVNPKNAVKSLTIEQIKSIYTGVITNWKDLGGADAPIVVVSREDGSGTRTAFEELAGFKGALTANSTIKDGNGNVSTYIAQEQNAIGYISFVTLDGNAGQISALSVDGVAPTVAGVKDKSYKISRTFYAVYKEANLNDTEKAFVNFLLSDEGQKIVVSKGAISIK